MAQFGLPPPRSTSPMARALEQWAAENAQIDEERQWPTARVVAAAIVAACRARDVGQRPDAVFARQLTSGAGSSDDARKWAYYALRDAFPETRRAAIVRLLGARKNPARLAAQWDRQRTIPERAAYNHPPFWWPAAIEAARDAIRMEESR